MAPKGRELGALLQEARDTLLEVVDSSRVSFSTAILADLEQLIDWLLSVNDRDSVAILQQRLPPLYADEIADALEPASERGDFEQRIRAIERDVPTRPRTWRARYSGNTVCTVSTFSRRT